MIAHLIGVLMLVEIRMLRLVFLRKRWVRLPPPGKGIQIFGAPTEIAHTSYFVRVGNLQNVHELVPTT